MCNTYRFSKEKCAALAALQKGIVILSRISKEFCAG
jgi:hypothetical protein